jgi:large subunit ribosomal protein L15
MAAPKKSTASKSTASKSTASKAAAPKATAPKATAPKRSSKKTSEVAATGTPTFSLATLKPNPHSRPKRTRVGRGHGSGMVKTGGEGGKGQTVRSGGGKGPAFEGGQTPWNRRLPIRRGVSQKSRDIGHFRSEFAVINIGDLAGWDASIEVSPQSLREHGKIKSLKDGVKVLGGSTKSKAKGGTLPAGLKFRDMLFSASAREALGAVGADFGDVATAKAD